MTVNYSHDFGLGMWLGADAVVSSKTRTNAIKLTHGEVPLLFPKSDQARPVGLSSKVGVYGEDLAISYAGNISIAEDALHTIYEHYPQLMDWGAAQDELIRASCGDGREAVSFLTHKLIGSTVELKLFGSGPLESGSCGRHSFAIGSGAKLWLQAVQQPYIASLDLSRSDASEQMVRAIALHQSAAAFLLSKEVQHQETLANGFGGVFESVRPVSHDDGRLSFEKIEDTTIVYWPIWYAGPADIEYWGSRVHKHDVLLPALPIRICVLRYFEGCAMIVCMESNPWIENGNAIHMLPAPGSYADKTIKEAEVYKWYESQNLNTKMLTVVWYGNPLGEDCFMYNSCRSVEYIEQNRCDIWIDVHEDGVDYEVCGKMIDSMILEVRKRVGNRRLVVLTPGEGPQLVP